MSYNVLARPIFVIALFYALVHQTNTALVTLKDGEYEKLDRSGISEGSDPALGFIVSPGCTTCKHYETLATKLSTHAGYRGTVYILPSFAGINSPNIIMFNAERILPYKGALEIASVMSASRQFSNGVRAARLTDSNFEHDTQASTGATTGHWVVVFDTMTETSMKHHDGLANTLRTYDLNIGVVDNSAESKTSKRFKVADKTRKIFLLKKGVAYTFDKSFDLDRPQEIIEFATKSFAKYPNSVIPRPVMPFDEVVDFFVRHVKMVEEKYGKDQLLTIGAAAAGLLSALIIFLCVLCVCCCRKSRVESAWMSSKKSSQQSTSKSEPSVALTRKSTRAKAKKD